MYKSFFSLLSFIIFITFNSLYGQDSHSIQINGGIISPISSSKGLTAAAQYNYTLNPVLSFYIYWGYSFWDKNKIVIHKIKPFYQNNEKEYYNTYNQDDHILIPIFLGSKINLQTNSFFTSYINIEIGYTHLRYNKYNLWKSADPETGEVFGYFQDQKTEAEENLFGVGVGAGLSHPVSGSVDLLLAFKLNSFVNKNYHGLFSRRGTYTSFIAGINFSI